MAVESTPQKHLSWKTWLKALTNPGFKTPIRLNREQNYAHR